MTASSEKIKQLLYEKLECAERLIIKIMDERAFMPDDEIHLLLSDIQERLQGQRPCIELSSLQLEDIYVNLIMGVISQDLLEQKDEINLLLSAIRKRLEDFDNYFEKLEKGELKGPF